MKIAVALAVVVAGAAPANACEDHAESVRVHGVTADGSFIVVERIAGGRVFDSVTLFSADAKQRARCELGESERGAFDTWQCTGERAFRATGTRSSERIAASWARRLGGTTPLEADASAPVGVTEAICARVRTIETMAKTIQCDAGTAHVMHHASSPLVFLEEQIEPWRFCGGISSHHDTVWVTRAALEKRLDARIALFRARRRDELAQHATEARTWVRGRE